MYAVTADTISVFLCRRSGFIRDPFYYNVHLLQKINRLREQLNKGLLG
jgi:hypothetical protein